MASVTLTNTKTAEVNGASLAYVERGDGEAVVFVHGGMSDLRTWEQQLSVIGRSYRAVTYSRRYARPNDDIEPGTKETMLPHVDDLVAFLKEIDAAPAHLVGNSYGAFISLLTAIHHPSLVRSLVLEEPPVAPLLVKSTPPGLLDLLHLVVTRPRTAMVFLPGVARIFVPAQKAFQRGEYDKGLLLFAQGVLGKQAFDRLSEDRKQQMRDNVSTLPDQLDGFPQLVENQIRSVKIPALVVEGELSPPATIVLMARLDELLPNSERIRIPDASHLMHEQNPVAVNEVILAFLRPEHGLNHSSEHHAAEN